ncbi:MAG: RNA methyltransferase [Ruminiclostridium sp.]|nr:RNA methyltransferase [Ruminiclostridium sp.]
MEISSRKNPLIKQYCSLVSDRKSRRENGFFACEGNKLCNEAAKSGCTLGENAFVTETAAKKYPDTVKLIAEKCNIITITEDIAQYISDTKTPQGIFITVKLLDKILNLSTINNSANFLILENLQDTGNVGTIIRTCDAFKIDGIIMSTDCADPFSPKTVRSTMGSIFRVPIYFSEIDEAIAQLKDNNFTVYAALLDKKAKRLGEEPLPRKTAVVIGNEGNGVTNSTAASCGNSLYIPMDNAESLNTSVAASIIAWEISKSRNS